MANKETVPKTVKEQEYPLQELKANALQLFGVQPEVIDGALYGNENQKFSVSELKEIVSKFLTKKVK